MLRSFEDGTPINFNPHHSWLGLTEQQNLTLFRGEARVIVLGKGTAKPTERSLKGKGVGAKQGGLLSFYNGCKDGEVRCNGRSEQGKDA